MRKMIFNIKVCALSPTCLLGSEQEDFSQFGKSFQEDLCQLILSDRAFADQMLEVLDLKFLELHYLRVFVHKIWEYKEKYKAHFLRIIFLLQCQFIILELI